MEYYFIEQLELWENENTRVRAILRRSLSFNPGEFPLAYPYVERFLSEDSTSWKRKMFYLTAGLWANQRRSITNGEKRQSLQTACRNFYDKNPSGSFEKRFLSLLDADEDQLSNRLRQILSILEEPIDFTELLKDLLKWNYSSKKIQLKWAKEFYVEKIKSKEI